ncbi:MAG: DUF4381 domain-containing protein [Halieaceae bacterium]
MNPEMMLAQLAPLREPPPIGWWPLAPGWWVLTVVAVIAMTALAVWLTKRHRQRRYRRIALVALSELRAQRAGSDAINRLLKAAALQAYPSDRVAALHGPSWLQFLASTCQKLETNDLAELEQRYQRAPSIGSDTLYAAAEQWIRGHEVRHA